jgi:hypothetical protein
VLNNQMFAWAEVRLRAARFGEIASACIASGGLACQAEARREFKRAKDGGRYRTRTYDLVGVKQCWPQTGVDW